jgi:hypothetical protein
MGSRRLLTVGPENDPLWVRLYVQPVGESWAAMLVGEDVSAPESDELKGLGFLGPTAEAAERGALDCVGLNEPVN